MKGALTYILFTNLLFQLAKKPLENNKEKYKFFNDCNVKLLRV